PYTLHHLTETTQILTFTFIAFWLLRRQLAGEPTIALDTDWFYRRPAPLLWRSFVVRVGAFFDWTESIAIAAVGSAVRLTRNPLQAFNARASESVDRADFDPDFYRRPMENLIVLVLLGVVVLSVVGLIWILT
ncbi:MAG: hypothetical protein HY708_02430, partial [Ignavibacteriae bacterium]|nr:hypothetical protein [Ignavibacteriota bacterium]